MKNSKKGFANVILIVIIVAIVVVGGYFVFSKKSTTPTPSQQNSETNTPNEPNQGQGASFVPEQDRIQITSPKGGEKLEVGKTYDIRWTNYSGKEPLTIALQTTAPDNKVSAKIVASNVPAASIGSYKWTVTSENSYNKYKIEVYPAGGRELVGRSKDFFTISGGQLITITSPKPNDRVNLTQPIVITGKARNVFGEGEFDISASYLLDNQKKVVARTLATCNITGNGCDWTSGNFVDFKSTLDLSSAPVCYVSVEFYKRDDKTPQTQPFYVLPLYLFGNENCQSPLLSQKYSFETIAKNYYSGHNERKDYVIKEISEWRSLWDIVNAGVTPKPALPIIDFDDETVIAVFQGVHSTGGYSIEIVEILEKANSLEVTVKETSPSSGSNVTQAFTQPFHIVKTKIIGKEVVFVH